MISLVTTPLLAEEVPGKNLLDYFSANCTSQGEWARTALNDSIALIENLRSINKDPDFLSVAGAITQLDNLNKQIESLQIMNSTQEQIAILNAQEQDRLFAWTHSFEFNWGWKLDEEISFKFRN